MFQIAITYQFHSINGKNWSSVTNYQKDNEKSNSIFCASNCYRVFHSVLIYFGRLDGHQICILNSVWRLPWRAEMRLLWKCKTLVYLSKAFRDMTFSLHYIWLFSILQYNRNCRCSKQKHNQIWKIVQVRDKYHTFS